MKILKLIGIFATAVAIGWLSNGCSAFAQTVPTIHAILVGPPAAPKALAIGQGSGSTVTLPGASSFVVDLSWTASTSCSSTDTCTYAPYRMAASSCPTTLTGTTGWTALTATAAQATTDVDSSVVAGTTYIYVVEAVQGTANSGPSNCIVVAVPNAPAAPTGLSGTL